MEQSRTIALDGTSVQLGPETQTVDAVNGFLSGSDGFEGSGEGLPPYLDTQGKRSFERGISHAEEALSLEVQTLFAEGLYEFEERNSQSSVQKEIDEELAKCREALAIEAQRPFESRSEHDEQQLLERVERARARLRAEYEAFSAQQLAQDARARVRHQQGRGDRPEIQNAVGPAGKKPTYKKKKGGRGKEYIPRSTVAKPVSSTIYQWKREFSSALRGIAYSCDDLKARAKWIHAADKAVDCATNALTYDCGDCGERNASVVVLAQCGLRACPACARRSAEKRRERLSTLWATVPLAVERERSIARSIAERDYKEHQRKRDRWLELQRKALAKVEKAKAKGDCGAVFRWEEKAENHGIRAANSEAKRSLRKWAWYRLGETYWSPKLITLGEPWNPEDPEECSIRGLKKRAERVLARWAALWRKINVDGIASAVVQVELSADGFVHLHALYYGPWLVVQHLADLAWCFVHVREADGLTSLEADLLEKKDDELTAWEKKRLSSQQEALKEALKYTIKAPTVLSQSIMSGEKGEIVNPVLAARWCVAVEGLQIARLYGLVRDLAPEEPEGEEEPDEIEPGNCPACGCCLSIAEPRFVKVEGLARELGALWSVRVSVRRKRE